MTVPGAVPLFLMPVMTRRTLPIPGGPGRRPASLLSSPAPADRALSQCRVSRTVPQWPGPPRTRRGRAFAAAFQTDPTAHPRLSRCRSGWRPGRAGNGRSLPGLKAAATDHDTGMQVSRVSDTTVAQAHEAFSGHDSDHWHYIRANDPMTDCPYKTIDRPVQRPPPCGSGASGPGPAPY